MKKYLNQAERVTILYLCNLLDRLENMIKDWDARGNLTKEERKNLKSGFTFTLKGFESILYRQDTSVIKNIQKEKERSAIHLDLAHSLEILAKKKTANLEAAYNENREYFRLVELIMDNNCKGCKKECGECEFFKEFMEQCVPYADGDEQFTNCKYSY